MALNAGSPSGRAADLGLPRRQAAAKQLVAVPPVHILGLALPAGTSPVWLVAACVGRAVKQSNPTGAGACSCGGGTP